MTDPITQAFRDADAVDAADGYDLLSEDEQRAIEEEARAEQTGTSPLNLPAPFGSRDLDVEGLSAILPDLRRQLIAAVRESATQHRAARGTVVVPEDGYGLTRRLVAGGEVLRQAARVFEAAAQECDALVEEEALTAVGEQDGVPLAGYYVPDGEGQRIAVRPAYKAGESTWDVQTLIGFLVEEEIADYKTADPLQRAFRQAGTSAPMMWSDDQVAEVARAVVERLLALGKYTPGVKPVEALRRKLAEQQRDDAAGVLRQVRSVGPRQYTGVKIEREPVK